MSWEQENLADPMFEDWLKQSNGIWEPEFIPTTWTPERGGTVFIKDMTTDHITNCISWLKRERTGWPYVNRMVQAFEAELKTREPVRPPKFYSLD